MATFSVYIPWYPKPRGRCVAYLRKSERPHTKLDFAGQREAISALVSKSRARLIDTVVELEPLINGQRPALEVAVELCKAQNATLIFGRISRMRGCHRWLQFVRDERVRFIGADIPTINSLGWWEIGRDLQREQANRNRKIKEALAKTKALGVSLGGKRDNAEGLKLGPAASTISRNWRARSRDSYTMSKIELLQHRGITTLSAIATRLNQMGHPAPRGGTWSPSQVRAVIKKFES
ncbi:MULTISPECIES: hypothetical protein [unclassified Novosphingobium]|uniref:hypothetical protein n=1 Tax=unclassified Novosphingobium TaxID=2644732 RepID=UPI0025D3204A|nr:MULTISPECIES: hypothetical protein [unclassified Novosphingobium]